MSNPLAYCRKAPPWWTQSTYTCVYAWDKWDGQVPIKAFLFHDSYTELQLNMIVWNEFLDSPYSKWSSTCSDINTSNSPDFFLLSHFPSHVLGNLIYFISRESKKRCGFGWEWRRGLFGRSWGRENCNHNIFYENKLIKRKLSFPSYLILNHCHTNYCNFLDYPCPPWPPRVPPLRKQSGLWNLNQIMPTPPKVL